MSLRTSPTTKLQPGNGYRLPAEAYYAQEWFAREQRQLFRRTWNFVGQSRDLLEPGDYLTMNVGGAPILVLRDLEGQLRAFHNICRHRGAKLLDAVGNCIAISCPYHRWRYRLDGSLDHVPQQSVELHTWLAEMPEIIGAFSPQHLQALTESVFEFKANWKFYIENHVDWYHLWYTHPQTLRMWEHHEGQMLQCGPHWASFEPARTGQRAMTPPLQPIPGLSDRQRQNGAHYLFPNLTLFTGEGYFATGLVTPLSPARACMHFRVLVAPDQAVTPELASAVLQAFRDITEFEDAGMTERLQATVESDAFTVGPMTMRHEAPIARLHDEYLAVFEG